MVLVFAIVVSLLVGLLTGGSFKPMGQLRIRYLPLLIAGLFIQILIFTPILGTQQIIHDIGPYIYIGTLLTTLFVMYKNIDIPGMPVIMLGAFLNALVITANGGFMPSPESALEDAGLLERVRAEERGQADGDYVLTNSKIADDDTRLDFLGDVLVVPEGIPLSNVYSIGDIVIAIGAAIAIIRVMHRRPEDPRPERVMRDA